MADEIIFPGLVEDTRSEEAKEKDYQSIEIAPQAVALKWYRDISGCPVYSVRDQNGSSSCVSQAIAKAVEILKNGEVESAHPIYARRPNAPGLGMYLQAGASILRHQGTTTEALDPSQNMTEAQMNAPVTVPTPINGYLYAFPQDIDEIATAIEVNKHCIITLGFHYPEYAPTDKPVYDGKPANAYHAICGIYYFRDSNGEKCIVADESWGPFNIRRRILTESYLNKRRTGGMYFIKPTPTPPPVKPSFYFQNPLTYGMMNNYAVKNLQDILKYEGLMDVKVFSTGNYLEITRKAVLAWQIKHNVAAMSELTALNGRRVGQKTINALNAIYAQ